MSTIDQQIVRISTKRAERTISRKIREIALANLCNYHLSKKQMLDYYLHNAYMGYLIEGCEDAANTIFGKPAAELTWEQAALIASLYALPFPKAAWEKCSVDPCFPFDNPYDLLEMVADVAPRWTKRVRARMEYAIQHQDFRPKSL